jgi:hypothetical protein
MMVIHFVLLFSVALYPHFVIVISSIVVCSFVCMFVSEVCVDVKLDEHKHDWLSIKQSISSTSIAGMT